MTYFWDQETVFFDGDHYFEEMLADIDRARDSITVEMYLFRHDPIGSKVAAHLIQAQKRGVRVQVMVDGIGSHDFFTKLYGVLIKHGIKIKIYNPLPFFHPFFGKIDLRRRLSLIFTRLWRVNSRNHRKIITIDSRIMFVGSFNITAEHTRFHQDEKWKDMGVKVVGDNVRYAVLQFKKIWSLRDYYRYRKKLKELLGRDWKGLPLRLNHNLFMRRYYYQDLLNRMKNAQQRIWLTTPYFIPKGKMIKLLGEAAAKGVDVRLLISSKSDVTLFQTLQQFYYPFLLKQGVKIYQYRDSILHAKNFIIDDWMTVGSSNLNHRSILHDLEVDLVIQNTDNKLKIVDAFVQSSQNQLEITADYLKQRRLFDRFLTRLFFLFKYWF
jgi:cardiolipin synthase A/B